MAPQVIAVAHASTRVPSSGTSGTRVDADGWPILPPTLLTIHRTSEADEQSRQIVCVLDGRRIGQLLYGETLTVEVTPGPHRLRVHNTLVWKTRAFDIKPGEHAHFTVWNRGTTLYYLMSAFLGVGPLLVGLAPGRPEEVVEARRSRSPLAARNLDGAPPNAANS